MGISWSSGSGYSVSRPTLAFSIIAEALRSPPSLCGNDLSLLPNLRRPAQYRRRLYSIRVPSHSRSTVVAAAPSFTAPLRRGLPGVPRPRSLPPAAPRPLLLPTTYTTASGTATAAAAARRAFRTHGYSVCDDDPTATLGERRDLGSFRPRLLG